MSCLTMEALQMLKFHLKKSRLDFMAGWATPMKDMVVDDPEEDHLAKLLTADTDTGGLQDLLDGVIRRINDEEQEEVESQTPESNTDL
jgi:hypothetical protein